MERYYDTMRHMMILVDTGIESLEYLSAKLKNNLIDVPMYLYADFIKAFILLCKCYKILERSQPENRIGQLEDMVANELTALEFAFQVGDMISMGKLLEIYLIPVVKAYRYELALICNPHILC